jgi:glycogen operon protein
MGGEDSGEDLHVMLNAGWTDQDFEVPRVDGRRWFRAVDTALPPPGDIAEAGSESALEGDSYHVEQRSVVVLVSRAASVAESGMEGDA